ncbi:MAG: circadian clock protein KaiB [Gemmatimonadetes bacterium]|nr:circadian clock protein KaiB [Gemmatimonadota bacterium]
MAARPARAGQLRLRLYVAGNAPNSRRAIANLTAICDEHFAQRYELEIVDLIDEPRRASSDEIIVTPTLLRLSPSPKRRVVGSLSDSDEVLLALSSR